MEILVKAESHTHPDPTKDRRGAYKKGDVVVVMTDGHSWGDKEGPPRFVRVSCPALNASNYQDRANQWTRRVSLSVISSDNSIDEHRVSVTVRSEDVSASGGAKVTRDQAEGYINGWNGTVVSTNDNEVVFDISIEGAITSRMFWGVPQTLIDPLSFADTYNDATGTHTLQIGYGSTELESEAVENRVENVGGVVLVNDGSTCTCELTRDDVQNEFLEDLRERLSGTWKRRRYYFDPAAVDTVLDQGGEIEVTATTLASNVNDRLNE